MAVHRNFQAHGDKGCKPEEAETESPKLEGRGPLRPAVLLCRRCIVASPVRPSTLPLQQCLGDAGRHYRERRRERLGPLTGPVWLPNTGLAALLCLRNAATPARHHWSPCLLSNLDSKWQSSSDLKAFAVIASAPAAPPSRQSSPRSPQPWSSLSAAPFTNPARPLPRDHGGGRGQVIAWLLPPASAPTAAVVADVQCALPASYLGAVAHW